jgi:hypothetical protein
VDAVQVEKVGMKTTPGNRMSITLIRHSTIVTLHAPGVQVFLPIREQTHEMAY